jgi:hypothetical protein
MVQITIVDGTAVFEVLGWHKLWALRGRLTVPVAHITSVRPDPTVTLGWGRGIRILGTHFPGRIKAGLFYERGRRVFWDVAHPALAIVVELRGHRLDALVVEVADPGAAAALLQDAIRGQGI